jgi:uncharacterized protein (TIGR03437 family)
LAVLFGTAVAPVTGIIEAPGVPWPEEISGVSLTLDGIRAPLYGIANVNGQEQINFQVPWELAGRTRVTARITASGQQSEPVMIELSPVAPGIFTRNGLAITTRYPDHSEITRERRARAGDILTIYVTGLGAVNGTVPTGRGTPRDRLYETVQRPDVTIGGVAAEVLFSGLTPDWIGLYQINVRVAPGTLSGEQDVVIRIGGAESRPAKTVVE